MLTTILSLILSLVFLILGIIHFNWVFGGKWGFEKSLPTDDKGIKVLNPRKIDSAVVAVGLTAFCFFYLIQSGLIELYLPLWIPKYGKWIIPSIFILRAVGDFRYVGFFKRVVGTNFGKLDTKLYSPLCLGIGIIGITIAIITTL